MPALYFPKRLQAPCSQRPSNVNPLATSEFILVSPPEHLHFRMRYWLACFFVFLSSPGWMGAATRPVLRSNSVALGSRAEAVSTFGAVYPSAGIRGFERRGEGDRGIRKALCATPLNVWMVCVAVVLSLTAYLISSSQNPTRAYAHICIKATKPITCPRTRSRHKAATTT